MRVGNAVPRQTLPHLLRGQPHVVRLAAQRNQLDEHVRELEEPAFERGAGEQPAAPRIQLEESVEEHGRQSVRVWPDPLPALEQELACDVVL